MLSLKKIKGNIFHRSRRSKLITKLVEELSELQKELLKGRFERAIGEIGDVKALLKIFEQEFNCQDSVKKAKKRSLIRWKDLRSK